MFIYVIKTNLILHYLSSVYFVSQPLHVSGIFVAHHHGYTVYIQQLVRVVLLSRLPVGQQTVVYAYIQYTYR